jgi:phospholipase D1/2
MNAYVHLIKHSQHFIYMENQFFVTSCVVEGTTIHNKIGDALVERIIRAHENDEHWGACIVIPLMPGFQNSVDSQDGTSIRLIMQCQFRSINRGESSIFGRLRARAIDPEDYIRFYSLRQWGKIGPKKVLTTEQLYIHAKCMVVDDRSVIIGSANINERSMLGSRDSEVAAVVTDTRMVPSFMGGEPFDVGEFAHTLRKRLMREHLGIDVDAIYRREQAAREREEQDAEMARIYLQETRKSQGAGDYFSGAIGTANIMPAAPRNEEASSSGNVSTVLAGTTRVGSSATLDVPQEQHDRNKRPPTDLQHDLDVEGYGFDNMKALVDAGDVGLTDSFIDTHGREVLLKKNAPDAPRIKSLEDSEVKSVSSREPVEEKPVVRPPYPTERMDTYSLGLLPRSQLPELPALDDTDIGGPALTRGMSQTSSTKFINPLMHTLKRPEVHEDCMNDPLIATFYYDIWHQVAENNTKIYRQVFRCMPDSDVLDWRTYERFNEYNERFMQSQGLGSSKPHPSKEAPDKSGPPGSAGTEASAASIVSAVDNITGGTRPRSKSVLGNFVDKFRPSSRLSEDLTHTEETREKEAAKAEKNTPESPGSQPSSGATATPSPKTTAVDEKEAQNLADEAEQNQTEKGVTGIEGVQDQQPSAKELDEKEGIKGEDMAFNRQKTVQYSDEINLAPETTATQTATQTGLQHSGSQKRRRRGTTKSSARVLPEEVLGREEAEELLKLVQGHLVLWSYDWYVQIYIHLEIYANSLSGLRKRSEEGTGCIILTNWHR